jgi:hypothetical protein
MGEVKGIGDGSGALEIMEAEFEGETAACEGGAMESEAVSDLSPPVSALEVSCATTLFI